MSESTRPMENAAPPRQPAARFYKGKEVLTQNTFDYSTAQVGDYVEQAVVDDAIEKYEGLTNLDKLTAELAADLLRSVKVWPDGRVNVELNYLDEIPHAVVRNLMAAI